MLVKKHIEENNKFFINIKEGLFTLILKKYADIITSNAIIAKFPTSRTLVFNNLGFELHVFVYFSNIYPAIDENIALIVTKLPLASKCRSNTDIHTTKNEINPITNKYLQTKFISLENLIIFFKIFFSITNHHITMPI